MRANTKGFGTIGLLIIVFTIGLLGAFIWTVFSRQNTTFDSTQTTAEQGSEIHPSSETADWKTETIDKYGISFKYPKEDDWNATFGVVDSLLPGHEAHVGVNYTQCGSSCGFALSIGIFDKEFEAGFQKNFGEEQMKGNNVYTLTSKKTVTIDKAGGTRWEYTPNDDSATKIIYYYLSKDDFSYTFAVNNNGATTDAVDLTATGEKIVSTVQFIK